MSALNYFLRHGYIRKALRIGYGRYRKRTKQLIHYIRYRFALVPRMPTHDGTSQDQVYYPPTPFPAGSNFPDELYDEVKLNLSRTQFDKLLHRLTKPPLYTTVRADEELVDQVIDAVTQSHAEKCQRRNCEQPKFYRHDVLRDLIIIEPQASLSEGVRPHGKEVIVDLRCGQAVLRGADVFCGGVMGAPLDLRPGDQVAVFCDIEAKCLQGWSKPYSGQKVFVGNGVSQVRRKDLYGVEPKTGGTAHCLACSQLTRSI